MIQLNNLKNTHRPKKKIQRVGRGTGSKRGKTSCRGHKGDKSRSGYKRRESYEGGRMRMFMKLPTRGFSREKFREENQILQLFQIERWFSEGETVSVKTLYEKGYAKKGVKELRILSQGDLNKKVQIEAHHFSKKALEKLQSKQIPYQIISP